jgi:hypothetical protein
VGPLGDCCVANLVGEVERLLDGDIRERDETRSDHTAMGDDEDERDSVRRRDRRDSDPPQGGAFVLAAG